MRKLIISILAITFLFVGSVCAYDEGGAINIKEESRGSASDPVRVYTLVRNPRTGVNAIAISAGDVLLWDCNSDDGVTINIVTEAGQSSDAVAGVAVGVIPTADGARTAVVAVGAREWGYIQTYGLHTTVNFDVQAGAAAVGQTLVASPDIPGVCQVTETTDGIHNQVMGFAYDAEASTADAEVFLRLR